jgi:hypothetical protein
MLPEQERPAVWMLPAQQLAAPPGLLPHPEPPQVPQAASQQTLPDWMPVRHWGSERTHGAPLWVQERPESRMLPTQQAALPPGRVLQPDPPQLPQLAAQQTSDEAMPFSHSGSEISQGFASTWPLIFEICEGAKKCVSTEAPAGHPVAEQ